ncbi:MAG: hypothetical protein FWE40_05660 [Oscillospiraceae bacterium]|nr:hypothetical protein [Oscillospiraceae bacterium]
MKKILPLVLALVMLAGRSPAQDDTEVEQTTPQYQPVSGLVVSNVVATPAGMTFTLENRSHANLYYGFLFNVVRYEGGRWGDVPIVASVLWPDLLLLLEIGETKEYAEDWTHFFGELPPGRYMFIREMRWDEMHRPDPAQTQHLMIEFEL